MLNFQDDRFSSEELANNYFDASGRRTLMYDTIAIKDFTFMPSIQISLLRESPKIIQKLYKSKLLIEQPIEGRGYYFDFDELSTYIQIALKVHTRTGTQNSIIKTHFNKCTMDDFRQQKYEPTPEQFEDLG